MNLVIGLTGPTGAGKSSVSAVAKALGFKVIDCDLAARKAVEKGSEGLKAVISAFGEDVLNTDGTLNRSTLAKIAFSDKEKTQLLNKTLFPFITEIVKAQIDAPFVLLDAPTLFESGINGICNATIAVLADESIRKARIMARDKIDEQAALLRIGAGKSQQFYENNADYIIFNNSELSEFQKQTAAILIKISEEFKNG